MSRLPAWRTRRKFIRSSSISPSGDCEPESGKSDLLGETGPFAQLIEGFQARPQQQAMLEAVQGVMHGQGTAVIEAGTGVGKTFAYLAPALLCDERVIVSTGSKTLQDQLYHKDLPLVRKALKSAIKTALLKGRANYLCIHRLKATLAEGRLPDRKSVAWLRRIRDWSELTSKGDVAELSAVPHDAEVWAQVTSTTENCLGAECEHYQDCYVVKARRAAQEADLVVVNHHLFFADMALKEEGFGELLPQASVVVLDEAHQLPEIASNFFSDTLSSRQLLDWKRDTLMEALESAADMPQIRELLGGMEKAVLDLRLAMDTPGQRAPWARIRNKPAIVNHLQALQDSMDELAALLENAAERSKGLESCFARLQEQRTRLERLHNPAADSVQWFETFTRGFAITTTPLDVAVPFKKCMEELPCSWVMTSATLAVGQSFEHFNQRMGLTEAATLQLDSPFDYWRNALLYLPAGLPEPQDRDFVEALVEAAIPVINACGGRTFMLFTSYRALNEAAELLQDRIGFPLLIQGSSPQRDMIEKFRELGNAVLLGTSSFWEGVDVRGEALSCVIIDKLPFAAPNDPVMEARLEAIRQRGGNPFAEYQIPQAVIALKQGVGRLIRDQHDRGVLMICDVRLRTRSYGKIFLDSLPRMPRTQKLEIVERFFAGNLNETVSP
ncbi:ATP-dependent DNA helicase [Candidatus Thiothrix sp. Deng01]|uniref:ATP-dependent DNA helicase n=1 Tax=Candidatus Thiothrix phosphatis TaxID=3112415 RepID=A0ABU6CYP1_9GAMM|nr:ATP-dependent DNA helicase [Candidatus Thiothrix sp. Deng01]MEB4591955.1 ATP-dependent DNA helicase [Candidatus Thiothrix sp. Deng01]